jgi:hypothetical protein
MSDALHRLSYMSTACREMSQADLDDILAVARSRNPGRHLTGVLIYHDLQFFQSIEGPRSEIEDVFAHIRRDERHRGCVILESRPVPQRLFSRWFMAFRAAAELSDAQKQGFEELAGVHDHYAARNRDADNRTYILVDSFLSSFRDLVLS